MRHVDGDAACGGVAALAGRIWRCTASWRHARLEEFLEANAQDLVDLRIAGNRSTRASASTADERAGARVPGGLLVMASSPTSVSLQWSAVVGADGYVVHASAA